MDLLSILGLPESSELIEQLTEALTHSSFLGSANKRDYQRLEFLGDAVLGLVMSDMLYKNLFDISVSTEGELTQAKSKLTQDIVLAHVGKEWKISQFIKSSPDHPISDRVQADVVEAIIGAVYIELGYPSAYALILDHHEVFFETFHEVSGAQDNPKNLLQEYVQHHSRKPDLAKTGPYYSVTRQSGPSNHPLFQIKVTIELHGKTYSADGSGRTKLIAEKEAARKLFQKLLD